MKEYIIILLITLISFSGFKGSFEQQSLSQSNNHSIMFVMSQQQKQDSLNVKIVYVCMGPKAQCYHLHANCNGINKCSVEIKSVSQEKAIEMGRRPCKLCYK